jgi:hypothetical protein
LIAALFGNAVAVASVPQKQIVVACAFTFTLAFTARTTPPHSTHTNMVRVKFRYLVVNLLYPEPPAKSKTSLPDLVQIHSPTPDAFHAGVLMRLIRDEVEELFGDYGMGMLSSGLKGIQL